LQGGEYDSYEQWYLTHEATDHEIQQSYYRALCSKTSSL